MKGVRMKDKKNKKDKKEKKDLKSQPLTELTDEQLQQAVGGVGPSSSSIPPAGDEVLVSFEGGNPDRPYVLGSLWNSKPGS